MKRIRTAVYLAVGLGVMMLAGCGKNKEAISVETFTEKMEGAGLLVMDPNNREEQGAEIQSCKIALEEGKYQIEFYVFDKEKSAKAFYEDVQDGLENTYEDVKGVVKTSKNIANYGTYKLSADGMYFEVSRIGNTMVYAGAPDDYKDQIKDRLEELEY